MKVSKTNSGLTLRAIAGSHVVILAWSMDKASCKNCLGFAIHRTDHAENEAYWMEGMKTFSETDPGFVPGSTYPTNKHPIQGFTWSDFSAKPGHKYTYKVQALRGLPTDLQPFKEVEVTVSTEAEAKDDHNIYFNRGAAASQEYARRFGNTRPDEEDQDDPRWAWLSRGAMEAIAGFVARAKNSQFGLRVAAYEFRLPEFADLLKAAKTRNADVQICYDANPNKPDKNGHVFPRDENRQTAAKAQIKSLCKERVTRDDVQAPPIAHNKFIVLLKGAKPIAVLTGSTNFSTGGVYGQANVIHIVENEQVAKGYLDAWNLLKGDPDHAELRVSFSTHNNIPEDFPPMGVGAIFSPQKSKAALDWYAHLATIAPNALFMTFPFGMGAPFKEAYKNSGAELRYALLDKLIPAGTKADKKDAAIAEMTNLRKMKQNRFAVGSQIRVNSFDRWVGEKLTGLNQHVQYIHNKFMLIDPLGDDPIVITGSANFSEASTTANDENMLVIRGNKRVADIYVGEFMRLWHHYAFREWASSAANPKAQNFKSLKTDDSWSAIYFGDTDQRRQRQYFAGVE
jgi:phosphatidylserine/phosphatidylglycerophosphate/cardiolipin synthase-like enzyme